MTAPAGLSTRALNRTLLARQMLLAREAVGVGEALERLVGMQAQEPLSPYVGLWSRVEGFEPGALGSMVSSGEAVRGLLMRGTVHLVTRRDWDVVWPVVRPVLARVFAAQSQYGPRLDGLDLAPVLARGRELLAQEPLGWAELGRRLAVEWPEWDADALGAACRYHLPLVQVPPRGVWGQTRRALVTPAEPSGSDGEPDALVLRYLRAFGPATAADITTWSRLTGVAEVVERLRPQLRVVVDERGRELVDAADAPLLSEEVEAPPRFLPEFDNLLLSHAERSRVIPPELHERVSPVAGRPTLLVDGFAAGLWKVERSGGVATLVVEPFVRLTRAVRTAVIEEGERLLAWLARDDEPAGVDLRARSG